MSDDTKDALVFFLVMGTYAIVATTVLVVFMLS